MESTFCLLEVKHKVFQECFNKNLLRGSTR